MTHACNVHRLENVDVRSKVLKCEEVLYMCMHMEYTYVYVYLHITILLSLLLDYSIYIKNDYSPQPNGGVLVISVDDII